MLRNSPRLDTSTATVDGGVVGNLKYVPPTLDVGWPAATKLWTERMIPSSFSRTRNDAAPDFETSALPRTVDVPAAFTSANSTVPEAGETPVTERSTLVPAGPTAGEMASEKRAAAALAGVVDATVMTAVASSVNDSAAPTRFLTARKRKFLACRDAPFSAFDNRSGRRASCTELLPRCTSRQMPPEANIRSVEARGAVGQPETG